MTQPKTYFRDESETDIDGILVIESYDDGYWMTENRACGWCKPFYMPEQEFRTNTHAESVSKLGVLSDENMGEVVEAAE